MEIKFRINNEEEIYNALIEILNDEKNFDQKINYFENDILSSYFDNAIVNKSSIFLTKILWFRIKTKQVNLSVTYFKRKEFVLF